MTLAGWRVGLCLAVMWLLGGCASVQSFLGMTRADAPATEQATEPVGPPVFDVKIDAPARLAALLEAHLELVRLRTLPDGRDLDPIEWSRLVSATPAQARALLETEGYFDAKVQIRRESAVPPARAQIYITVDPGPRTSVSKVRIELQGDLDSDVDAQDPFSVALEQTINDTWPLPVGAPFRDPEWSRAKSALLSELRAAGFAAASMAGSSARVYPERQQADLLVVADSGPVFRAGEVRIEGLEHHDATTVKNLAGFEPGERLTEAVLLDFQERLANANLFDSATVTADTDPERAQAAAVTVTLRESPLQQATLGAGVSANTGPRASVEFTHRRPFDLPVIAANKIEWGRDRQFVNTEISTHPGDNFYRNLLGLQLERLYSTTDIVRSARLRVGRAQNTTRNERFYFAEVEDSRRAVTVQSTERPLNVLAASLNYQVVFRRLDSVVLPTDGYSLSLQGGIGGAKTPGASPGPFSRLYARFTGYRPIGDTWYGQARVELGQVLAKDGLDTPDSQRFRAGGDDSVRGYPYRSLAPTQGIVVDSGKVLLTGSVELARPIMESLPSVWGAVFVDAGRAADSWKGFRPALGYGVGARWRSPIGPLKLDLAYGQALREFRLHFSLGIAF